MAIQARQNRAAAWQEMWGKGKRAKGKKGKQGKRRGKGSRRLWVAGDGEWRDPRLRVGWFAAGCASRDADRPWAAAALQYEQRGAHGDNFCHRDDHEEAVSPFNLFEYVAHMKGRSGVMGTKRRAPD